MHGIHDVFPADDNNANDPISKNKLMKGEGTMLMAKTILGFDFDGIEKQCGWNTQNATNS
jgi:hypothetical protein